ncbi:hypothetical protein ABGT92_28695 [Streptomyces cinereoruber]
MGTRNRVAAAVVSAVLVGAGVFVATTRTSGDGGVSEDTAVASGPDADAPDPLGACVDSWNKRNTWKESIGAMGVAGQNSAGATAYVHVGRSAVFPDLWMVTIANSATMYAQQYVEDAKDKWGFAPSWTGTVSGLDPSVTSWNAKMAGDGTITLG